MKSKISTKQIFPIFILIGLTFLLGAIYHFINKKSIDNGPSLLVKNIVDLRSQEEIKSALPVRLRIPMINVYSAVEYVGIAFDGTMDIPKSPNDAAWFKLGVRPGDNGNAVIAGHYGWKNGIPAVFDDLYKLQIGDKIYVDNEKGETIIFVVRESRVYGENDDASEVFISSDGMAHLNLVTCQGIWNKTKKSYSERLVVFADREI